MDKALFEKISTEIDKNNVAKQVLTLKNVLETNKAI